MKQFESQRRIFRIQISDNWRQAFKDNIYDFYGDFEGVLQISAAFHPAGKQFVLENELQKTQIEHSTAHVTEVSKYKAIHYGLNLVNEGMLQYVWIIGHYNTRLLCTLTSNADQSSQKLDESYANIVNILDTLEIFPGPTSKIQKVPG